MTTPTNETQFTLKYTTAHHVTQEMTQKVFHNMKFIKSRTRERRRGKKTLMMFNIQYDYSQLLVFFSFFSLNIEIFGLAKAICDKFSSFILLFFVLPRKFLLLFYLTYTPPSSAIQNPFRAACFSHL